MLTKKELAVLELITLSYSLNEISEILMISKSDVKKCTASVYRKMGISNRVQATIKHLKETCII